MSKSHGGSAFMTMLGGCLGAFMALVLIVGFFVFVMTQRTGR